VAPRMLASQSGSLRRRSVPKGPGGGPSLPNYGSLAAVARADRMEEYEAAGLARHSKSDRTRAWRVRLPWASVAQIGSSAT
jgi:hypothetical protein